MAAAMLLPAAAPVLAQVAPYGEKTMGDPAQDHLPDVLNTVKIDQRLGQQLPLDASSATKPARPSSWEIISARNR